MNNTQQFLSVRHLPGRKQKSSEADEKPNRLFLKRDRKKNFVVVVLFKCNIMCVWPSRFHRAKLFLI